MKKKWISVLLAVIMTFTFTCSVLAADAPVNSTGLYIETEPCPEETIQYVQLNFVNYLSSLQDEFGEDISVYELGIPFMMVSDTKAAKVAYFPIIKNNIIEYTLRVAKTPDGQFTGVLSNALVNDLNGFSKVTMPHKPVEIKLNNDNVVSIFDGAMQVLDPDVEGKTINTVLPMAADESKDIVNCKERLSYDRYVVQPRAISSAYLATSIVETQDDRPWCAAYVAATIIRYKKDNLCVAYDIGKYFSKPNNQNFTDSEIIRYANKEGLYPQYKGAGFTHAMLRDQINNYHPVFMSFRNISVAGSLHALMMRGYNSSTYSVWNPWYSTYETMPAGTDYYVDRNNSTYQWTYSIVNW